MPKPSKIEQYLDTTDLEEGLAQRTAKSGLVTLVGQAVKLVVRLGSITIMARILTPDDYGVYAMVAVVMGIVMIFNELGLSQAAIQRKELRVDQINGLFWINVAFGCCCALLTVATAPLVAWGFDESRVTMLQSVLAIPLVISAASAMHTALIVRRMRFVALAVMDALGISLGLIVGIIAGIQGAGYWALAATEITFWLVRSVGSWILVRWVPRWPKDWTGVREMVNFGLDVTVYKLFRFMSDRIDQTLLGWKATSTRLGYYNRAVNVFVMPVSNVVTPISYVAIPSLSRRQDDPDGLISLYAQGLRALGWLVCPLAIWLTTTSDVIIAFLLGPQWGESVPLVSILGLAGIAYPIDASINWLFVPSGRTRTLAVWSFLSFCAAVPIFAVGYYSAGITGVAWAYVVSISFKAMLGAGLHSKSTIGVAIRAIAPPALCGAVAAGLAGLVSPELVELPLLVRLTILTIILGVCVLGASLAAGDLRRLVAIFRTRKLDVAADN